MRRASNQPVVDDRDAYFTYRPLSNLPTPPPSSRTSSAAQSPRTALEDGEVLTARYRGPAIHLVNLIPSSASLATASVPFVQALLSRADLPIETVALAVCILDSLDSRFARRWRVSCPLRCDFSSSSSSSSSKRHTLPPSFLPRQQLHIDSVNPALIILAALVIAVKFTEDPQEASQYYCRVWGRDLWSHQQLNLTERCIMEHLNYRIMPLCDDDCLTGAMVDMQLAEHQTGWRDVESDDSEEEAYVPSHSRSRTLGSKAMGLAIMTPDTPAEATPRPADYFQHYRS